MNRWLERLGYGPQDRVVIFHADDLGMCHAHNRAFFDIVEGGVTATGSIMMPCPWAPEMVAYARERAGEVDVGVHLTLNSEWSTYRWGALSTADPASGLLDPQGYLWPDVASLHGHMDAGAAATELRAQIEQALEGGVDVTHIDTHMGAVLHPALVPVYVELALEYRVPAMIPHITQEQIMARGVPEGAAAQLAGSIAALEAQGSLPVLDRQLDLYMASPEGCVEKYRALLAGLEPGLTHLLYHAATPGPELEGLMSAAWGARRICDYNFFSGEALAEILEEVGINTLTYRRLRELMREA
jgi:hypothetical protein